MNTEAMLLYYKQPSPSDVRLRHLVDFLGVPYKTLDISRLNRELDQTPDHGLCILTSASTMAGFCHDRHERPISLDQWRQKACFLFVYGFAPENNTISIAAGLADGQISSLRGFELPAFDYRVASTHPQITKGFSGLSFGPVRNDIDFGFVCSSTSGSLRPLISIAGLPFWAFLGNGGCTTFLLACTDVVDLQEKTDGTVDTVKYFSRLLPPAMFLKWVFKSHCWHSRHRFANFIIDDPLLKQSYGYLNYQKLLAEMDKSGFATTIAFIPWNYRRTQSATAQLFRERRDRFSLCIHGCDHTKAEFATSDLGALNYRVRLASHKMKAHRARTGLTHSDVMVFPQGRFSTEALKVLKCNNYLAAVNSGARPSSLESGQDLAVGDLLEPAITKYGGFPLFLRRYPGRLEEFAFDLFFAKPLLVVEHHGYLKDGGTRLVEFIAQLNSFGELQWSGLNEILGKAYLERDVSGQTSACKLYTNCQVIENQGSLDRRFTMTKAHSDDVPVDGVFVNNRTTDFVVADDLVQFTAKIPAHTSVNVNIVYRNVLPSDGPHPTFRTASMVWARRMLSEFRDEALCKSDFLLAIVRGVNHGSLGTN